MPLKMIRNILEQIGWLASQTNDMGFEELRIVIKEAYDLRRGIYNNNSDDE